MSWRRDLGARFLGYLGTATYVLWIGYLVIELAGIQWRTRLLVNEVGLDDRVAWAVRHVLFPASLVLYAALLAALVIVNRRSGAQFEGATPDRAPAPDLELPDDASARDRALDAFLAANDPWLRWLHVAAAAAVGGAVAAVWTHDERPPWLLATLFGSTLALVVLSLARYLRPKPKQEGQPPRRWDDTEVVTDRDFFAHHRSLERLRHRHTLVGAAVAGLVLAAGCAGHTQGRSRIGLAIVLVANAQVVILVLVWLAGIGKHWQLALKRAGMLTLGSVLCHAAFAGTALWLRDRLATIPDGPIDTPLPAGVELGMNDKLAIALLVIVGILVLALVLPRSRPDAEGVIVKLARRVPLVGVFIAFALLAPFAYYSVWVLFSDEWRLAASGDPPWHDWHDIPHRWYDLLYGSVDDGALQTIGSRVLLLLPLAFALGMRSSSSVGKVLGNLWDVLTFWPRRYHPYAVPPYAERAVPEVRARVTHLLAQGDTVVVSGHSQGSVLAVAALGPIVEQAPPGRLHLLTYGSPLGTMYAPVFPAAIGTDDVQVPLRDRLAARGGHWWVFWRRTDPIGGPVFDDPRHPTYAREQRLDDPPRGVGQTNPTDLATRPPLDRPPPWGTKRVHSWYPSEPEYRRAVLVAAGLADDGDAVGRAG